MTDAFDESMLGVFLKPWAEAGIVSLGFLGKALGKVVQKVDDVLGLKFVEDFSDFFRAFEGMYEGFSARAGRVNELLRAPKTSFVVVTSPQPLPLEEAGYLCDKLRELELRLDALVVNRVAPSALDDAAARAALQARLRTEGPKAMLEAAEQVPPALGVVPAALGPALRAFMDQELHAAGDRGRIDKLVAGPASGVLVQEVPAFARDVYDLGGLSRIVERLTPGAVRRVSP